MKLTRHEALTVLDEIQALADEQAAEYLPINQNAFARLVLYRLIQSLTECLPEADRRGIDLFRYFSALT